MSRENLIGQTFGNWKVVSEGSRSSCGQIKWICECQCEEKTTREVVGCILLNGKSKSCGCLKKNFIPKNKKFNKYDLSNDYGIGWTSNTNIEFYFDLEDYEKINSYSWREDNFGYITTDIKGKRIKLHRLIMNLKDTKLQVDHIYHKRNDNRKSQLRIVTNQENSFNKKSKGISYDKKRNKWKAYIKCDEVAICKRFDTKEEALEYRKFLEEKYFKDFAYKVN